MAYKGLTEEEVLASRSEHGQNILTPTKKTPWWKLYAEKFQDPIIQILLVAAAISLMLAFVEGHYAETIGIFVAIFLATTVGFLFELDAARKFDVLTQLNEDQLIKVIRRGRGVNRGVNRGVSDDAATPGTVLTVSRKDLVVGDVVIVETGDEIPADGELLESVSLQIDESMLTGEPLTTKASEGDKTKAFATAYAPWQVLRSTMVMNGRGVYKVTAVGDATEIGKVARQSSEDTDVKTPLGIQLDRLGKMINRFGFTLSAAAGLLFLLHDMIVNTAVWGPLWCALGITTPEALAPGVIDPGFTAIDWMAMVSIVLKYFMMAVTLIVMAVPEGLPMAVTLALALNMRRMLKSQNLVRKLHACETMGAVTVICTDKTGTLTQNRMKVSEQYILDAADKTSDMLVKADTSVLDEAIAVNTTAHLDDNDHGIGNPTEVALLLWLKSKGKDYRTMRNDAKVTHQEPFSTETKKMTTTVLRGGKETTYVKGAPEIVMAMCDISAEERKTTEEILLGYQHKAMRTLAVAAQTDGVMRLLAVFGISDPVREDVPAAVGQCHSAGINVKIVTGDVEATAMEIARQIGLNPSENPSENPSQPSLSLSRPSRGEGVGDMHGISISGTEFSALSEEEALKVVKTLKVMYRARPTDKQRLVQLLQKQGEVVAVTGDGTNDAPALNHAHVGLSLGSGTNVAKEASDMTLLDDSFASIVHAVMWGRSLFKNLQRFLFFQLVVNVAALLLVIAGSLVGTEMPLTVTQILWVNLIMDTFAALALASLPPSREVLADKPRNQQDFILTKGIIRGILATGILLFIVMFAFLLYCERGVDFNGVETNGVGIDIHELTLFFTTFVMLQWWNLLNAKTIGSKHSAFRRLWADRGLLLVLALTLFGQWLIVQFGGEMFRCVPLTLTEWIVVILATSPVMIIGELYRWISNR